MTARLPDEEHMIAAHEGREVIYFVEIGPHIKIGTTRKLRGRLRSFQTSSVEVRLLLVIPGGRDLERRLHELLSRSRIAREIFRADGNVMGFIQGFEYGGLQYAIDWIIAMSPEKRRAARAADRAERVRQARKTRAEENAYYASLVAQRVREVGW